MRGTRSLAVGGVVLALLVAEFPLAALAHQNVATGSGGGPIWLSVPFAVIGFVVAVRKPGNRLGWILLGLGCFSALAQDASFYVVACYRLRHGGLPFGWVALLAQPTWSITVVLIGLAILLFPDGLLPSPRLRWLLWVYLAVGTLWMAGAFALTIGAIAGHRVSVDAEGNLLRLDHPAGSAAWWGTAQTAVLLTIALSWLISLAGQVISYRDSCGERRQQLKWLLGGSAASLVGVFAGITLTGPVRIIGSAGILVAYAIVTGLLIGVYAGLVLLATEVLKLKGPVSVAAVVQSVLEPAHLSVWTTPASDT